MSTLLHISNLLNKLNESFIKLSICLKMSKYSNEIIEKHRITKIRIHLIELHQIFRIIIIIQY